MSVLQVQDLVSYQLRTTYLTEVADGVGERLITLNESIVNSAPFKAAGWRSNPGLIKRTHSPPIPTAVASEYFRAPRQLGLTLEDEPDDGAGVLGSGSGMGGFGGGGGRSILSGGTGATAPGSRSNNPATAATKRRRRREQMDEEEEDSSDLSDESDDDGAGGGSADQRAAQQIKFAKMPHRHRSGSSPLQSSNLRQPPITSANAGTASTTSPRSPRPPRRGSQSALEAVKERARRDTVTSSEVSSESEMPSSTGFQRHQQQQERREKVVAKGRAKAASARLQSQSTSTLATTATTSSSKSSSQMDGTGDSTPPISRLQRQESDLLEEEREDDDDDDDDDSDDDDDDDDDDGVEIEDEEEDSDGSDISSTFGGSIDSASILHRVENPLNAAAATAAAAAAAAAGVAPPEDQMIVGTPPREFTRTGTIRRSQHPLVTGGVLPPRRPVSSARPMSSAYGGGGGFGSAGSGPPRSLLSEALQAKKTAAAMPFDSFASLSGKGDPNPIQVRIYTPFSTQPGEPYEVPIRPSVQEAAGGGGERPVTVADLIGLSLWRYLEEKREPPLPANRLNVNWWTLRMVEEGGEVDDDFPPLERKRPLVSFTTANNNKGGLRFRSNSKVFDDFALAEASPEQFAENQRATPQFSEEKPAEEQQQQPADNGAVGLGVSGNDGDTTPRNRTPQPGMSPPPPPAPPASTTAAGTSLAPPAAASTYSVAPRPRSTTFLPLAQPRLNPILTTTYRHNAPHADAPAAPAAAPNTNRGRKKLLRVHIHSANAAPGQMVTVDVTTDTYLEEVLDLVCKKRQLDKNSHVLKLPGSGVLVLMDREVSSIGNVTDLDLYRKRGGGGGGGGGGGAEGSPSSVPSPKLGTSGGGGGGGGGSDPGRRFRKAAGTTPGSHPLARAHTILDETSAAAAGGLINDANYKKYTVWRRQGLKIMGSSERILTIDGEYVHIMHPPQPGTGVVVGKITTVHFSNVVGCKVSLRHPTHFKLIVYKATESKRYDFEAKSADEATEIVGELKKAMSPYRDI